MSHRAKVLDLDELAKVMAGKRQEGRTTALAHGCFDILHLGHVRYLAKARELCDFLAVTVTPDEFVKKGPHRPTFTAEQRAEVLAALSSVDAVAVNRWPTAVETLGLLAPSFYVKGAEYKDFAADVTGGIAAEAAACEAAGGKVAFIEDVVFSSSSLANRYYSPFPPEVQQYLSELAVDFPPSRMLGRLTDAARLRVAVVGETIIDEYHYVRTMGKAGKEPILAARLEDVERFAGGVLAIANHVAAFCPEVMLVSSIGGRDSHLDFIEERLKPHIKRRFVACKDAPTMVKRRFVERYPFQKLFETYVMNGEEEACDRDERFLAELKDALAWADVVIVADYGHGLLTRKAVDLLAAYQGFLAVNTQTNAGNHGFNTFSKYPRADLVSISENELRLEARSRNCPVEDLLNAAAAKAKSSFFLMTQGVHGMLCHGAGQGLHRVPALTGRVVDRIGAGDTVLAVGALAAAVGASLPEVGFLASVAGAAAVGTVCNRDPLDAATFAKHVTSLLK